MTGISMMDRKPEFERKRMEAYQNYLTVEISGASVQWAHSRIFMRVHHRSSALGIGLFGDDRGGSNRIDLGLAWSFGARDRRGHIVEPPQGSQDRYERGARPRISSPNAVTFAQ
jgi:hypothetical protein